MKRLLPLLIAWAWFGLAPAWAGDGERAWNFRVLLDGDEVGMHSFRVREDKGERQVQSEARFTVRFLFIDAYRYTHEAREQWQGDCLTRIEARTDDNGQPLAVRGERLGGAFTVDGPEGQARLADCVMSFAYWNPRMLQQSQLLNAQTGAFQPVRIESRGEETLAVQGVPQRVRRYALRGKDLQIDLWYADADDWVQLESRVSGGRILRYQRQ